MSDFNTLAADTAATGAGTNAAVATRVTGTLADQVLTPDSKSVLVSTGGGAVTRYDIATGTQTGNWQVGSTLGGMAVSVDGRYLYATDLRPVTTSTGNYGASNVARLDRLDLETGAVTRYDINVTGFTTIVFRDVAVLGDGRLLLTGMPVGGTGSVAAGVFDPRNGAFTPPDHSSYYYGTYTGALVGTADGKSVLIADLNSSNAGLNLYTAGKGITADRGVYTDSTYAQGTGAAIAISGDGTLIAQSVSHGGPDVLILDSALKLQTSLLQLAPQALVGTGVIGLAFSVDRAHLYVLNADSNQIFSLSTRNWSIDAVIGIDRVVVAADSYEASLYGDRLLASADGHYLTVQGDTGIQVVDLGRVTATPVLTALTFPSVVTIGLTGGNLFLTAGAIDATSVVQSVTLTLDHGLATRDGTVTEIRFDVGRDAFDDTYSATNLVLTGAAGGRYVVQSATVTDQAGHSVTYDAAALDALLPSRSFDVVTQVDLTTGDDTYRDTSGVTLTIRGLAGDDTLYAGAGDVTLDGGTGDDELYQGGGVTTFVGGAGYDVAVLRGNARDYYLVDAFYDQPALLLARNGTATQVIGTGVESVRFADGSVLSDGNRPAYDDLGRAGMVTGDYTLNAPVDRSVLFTGGSGNNRVNLANAASDYDLSRYQKYDGGGAHTGDFILTSKTSGVSYFFDQSVDTIGFGNGQYLALRDLPAFLTGSAALDQGGSQNDLLYQTKASGYELFEGARGQDDLYLNGNVSDYRVRTFVGSSEPNGLRVNGVELISTNGSGALLIDSSVETIHFRNGQYLSIDDVASYVRAAPATDSVLHVLRDGFSTGDFIGVSGTAGADDVLLLDQNASDFTGGRSGSGDFVLRTADGGFITASQNIDTIQFGNGQYLSLSDIPSYVPGTYTFLRGAAMDDILIAATGGNQYAVGGAGVDDLYLNGNRADYTLQTTHLPADYIHPAIDGYQLVATNGSGTIFIDHSVETVHFQNGQSTALDAITQYFG